MMVARKSLLISENFPPGFGGSGRWFWELYRRLPEEKVAVAAGSQPGERDFDRDHSLNLQRVPLTFPTRFIRPSSFGSYRLALGRLLSFIRREGIERIHAGRCLPEGLLALALSWRTGIPYGCFVHGEEVNLSNDETSPPIFDRRVYDSRELGLIVGLILRRASKVIANSHNTRSILTQRWRLPEERVAVLYPGVDSDFFRPAATSVAARARLGWQDRSVILTVGRLQKRKGHDLLISALPEIRSEHLNVLYAIAGTGEELESLRQLVAEKDLGNHVQFHTDIDDEQLRSCYQQCDLFVLPNRDLRGDIEGFGMVLLEAQACGKPVVAGASGGTAETMSIPETGLVVDSENSSLLAATVIELLSDRQRRESMGHRARSWVEQRFEWEALAAQAVPLLLDEEWAEESTTNS